MKTKEELNAFKKEDKALNKQDAELSDDELDSVVGGAMIVNHNSANAAADNEKMCELSMCTYTNKQDCPRYHVLPQLCVR